MTAKEYLEQYRTMQTRLNVLMAEIERLRTEAEGASIRLDGLPTGTGEPDKTARLAAQLADHKTVLRAEMSALWIRRMRIINELGQLKNHKHQKILQLRYIDCKSWECIAYEMGITWRHCYRLHGSALAEFDTVMHTGIQHSSSRSSKA